jgi:hypothetical protein
MVADSVSSSPLTPLLEEVAWMSSSSERLKALPLFFAEGEVAEFETLAFLCESKKRALLTLSVEEVD